MCDYSVNNRSIHYVTQCASYDRKYACNSFLCGAQGFHLCQCKVIFVVYPVDLTFMTEI